MENKELSIRQYAATLNCSHTAVAKAIREKKIVAGFNTSTGKIIPDKADNEWGNSLKSGKLKQGVSKEKRVKKLETSRQKVETKQKEVSTHSGNQTTPADEQQKVASTEPDEVESMDGIPTEKITIPAGLPLQEAVRRREIFAARSDKVKLLELEGTLVNKQEVDTVLYAMGYQLRKGLQAIPARIIDLILAAPNKVAAANLLQKEIDEVLLTYGKMEEIELTQK